MADNQSEIEIYAGPSSTGPVFEKIHARKVDEDTYELLSSPGLALNLAMGDIVSIKNKETAAKVLKRGGNFCIQIYSDHMPQVYVTELDREVRAELDGMLDGRYMGNLSLSIPSKNRIDKVNQFFDRFSEKAGIQWYCANI